MVEKVTIVQKVSLYEGTVILRVFKDNYKAKKYIEDMYPGIKKNKSGDWVINDGIEKEWISLLVEEVN